MLATHHTACSTGNSIK